MIAGAGGADGDGDDVIITVTQWPSQQHAEWDLEWDRNRNI